MLTFDTSHEFSSTQILKLKLYKYTETLFLFVCLMCQNTVRNSYAHSTLSKLSAKNMFCQLIKIFRQKTVTPTDTFLSMNSVMIITTFYFTFKYYKSLECMDCVQRFCTSNFIKKTRFVKYSPVNKEAKSFI